MLIVSSAIEAYVFSEDFNTEVMDAYAGDGLDAAALITIDASAYDGQVLYLSFRHYDTVDQNSVLIDALIVDDTLGTTNEIFQGFGYYVDTSSQLQLKPNSNMEKIELYNVLGQQILVQNLNSTTETINLSGFTSGVYIATVTIKGQTRFFKIVKR